MNIDLNSKIAQAIKMGASDVHICSKETVRCRLDDSILPLGKEIPFDGEGLLDFLLETLDEDSVRKLSARYKKGEEVDFGISLFGTRFRVNAYRDISGDNACMRIIKNKIDTPEELGLPPMMMELSKRRYGLVIITGATGSGKSTTLASLIEKINQERDLHIITIEDPIEFAFTNKKSLINQRQVGLHTESFAMGLRASLREDPDVVMIGELRDLETARAALNLAETGHIVFGTLHTSSAAGSIERIIDIFPHEEQSQVRSVLAEVLLGTLTQCLVPTIGGGRRAAFEFLISNSAVRNLIRESKINMIQNVLQTSSSSGMMTMKDSFLNLLAEGHIDLETAKKYYSGEEALLD
ncbi:MAG: PilT/PilU family type 4a pilus ATPase [Opitutales bacterium]